jgi:hypothetical protein
MKVLKYGLFAVSVLVLAAMPAITFAQSNTGLVTFANPPQDINYMLVAGPTGACQVGTPPCPVYAEPPELPTGSSSWISPFYPANSGAPGGSTRYDYQTMFHLAVPAALTARMAADNTACVSANGVSLNTCIPGTTGFKQYTYFSVDAASLQAGTNQLDFLVYNQPSSPTGLDVEFFCSPSSELPFYPNSPLWADGPGDGTTNTYPVNSGYVVSNSFTTGSGGVVQGFCFFFWTPLGLTSAVPQSVEASVTSSPFGGTTYFDANVPLTCQAYCNMGDRVHGGVCGNNFNNVYACTSQITPFELSGGTFWLNLQNGVTSTGGALSWDQAGGAGCPGDSCSSQAYDISGAIAPESFVIY